MFYKSLYAPARQTWNIFHTFLLLHGVLPEYLRLPNVLCKGFFNLRPVLREDDIILCNQLIHISYRVDTVRPISQRQPREGLYHLPPFVLL